GMWSGHSFTPDGDKIDAAAFAARRGDWLPTAADEVYIKSLMQPVYEPGKMASWIAPPNKGINGLPGEFVYVRI
ncbi:MAG TPA: benzoyl-CoA 2,3-epoxidase subunit BoxB, partial [Kofleriaceae bacterium]|nr:benzoyl-CoA 2,3-epoxidase subunit BoxB [Kofleriaceae bacterium]